MASALSGYDISALGDWKASVDKDRERAKNEHDIIIVGGGLGGLASGVVLSKNGYNVLLLEKNAALGGFASGYTKDGYHFSYGAEDISGVWERGCISYLLKRIGIKEEDLFTRNSVRYLIDGQQLDIKEKSFQEVLKGKFSEHSEAIDRFFAKAKAVYDEVFDKDVTSTWGVPLRQSFLVKAMPKEWLSLYPKRHVNMLEWMDRSYQSVLDEYFENDEIKRILCGLLGYVGARASVTSATTVIASTFGYYFYGGYRPKGGPQRLCALLKESIEKNGGTVLTEHTVTSVLISDNKIRGVCVQDTEYVAPVVIANVNAKTLYEKLIEKRDLPSGMYSEIAQLPMGKSSLLVHLGLTKELEAMTSLVKDMENRLYMIYTAKDPLSSPPHTSTLTLMRSALLSEFPSREDSSEAKAQDLIKTAEKTIPNLQSLTSDCDLVSHDGEKVTIRGLIKTKSVITPQIFEELTGVPEGAIYTFDQGAVPKRPALKSPIEGLYLASASSYGGGVEAVVMAGIICAHDVSSWERQSA